MGYSGWRVNQPMNRRTFVNSMGAAGISAAAGGAPAAPGRKTAFYLLYHSALALDAVEKSLASGPPSKTLTIYTFTAIPEEEA